MQLPDSQDVDVAVLAGLFADRTNSYKYLFLLSLLDVLQEPGRYPSLEPSEERVELSELGARMLVNAWYPHVYFRLSFGVQDQMGNFLDNLPRVTREKFSFDHTGRRALYERLRQENVSELVRYVPQRLIRGFFNEELRAVKDSVVDRTLVSLAREGFHSRRPLYMIDAHKNIVLYRDWVAYLQRNLGIVRGWAFWEWARYMQSRNPHVPAVTEKLFAPIERATLKPQTQFWLNALKVMQLRCPYSGLEITPKNLALDHFIPWSYVAHDRLWNLIPVNPAANSAKSDALPHYESFREVLLDIQVEGLAAARPLYNAKPSDWLAVTQGYVADLKVPDAALWGSEVDRPLLRSRLGEAYDNTMPAMLAMAKLLGFKEWNRKPAA